jgi:hypothetical protein
MMMPGLGAWDFLTRYDADTRCGGLPIAVLTTMMPGACEFESMGASAVIPQPIRFAEFAGGCPAAYFVAPILNILVPHSGQVPSVAGRPFFMVMGLAPLIWRWVLHFMQ